MEVGDAAGADRDRGIDEDEGISGGGCMGVAQKDVGQRCWRTQGMVEALVEAACRISVAVMGGKMIQHKTRLVTRANRNAQRVICLSPCW